jgi:soluble lytic murein transglycosylase-like protein
MLLMNHIDLNCINDAALEYHVPAKLIIAVLNVEGGQVGQAVKNTNGTYDLGPMQINSAWQKTLSQQDISLAQVRDNPCMNIKVGTWILSKNIADEQDLLNGIGDYHSHTTKLNQQYSTQIRLRYTELAQHLS